MDSRKRRIRNLGAIAAIGFIVVALAACGGGGGSSTNGGGTKQTGGTANWAELPNSPPNYIFPFAGCSYFSVSNLTQFQELMYRPLYWFGKGATPNLNPQLSLAQNPSYSNGGKTVTVNLKSYVWSNGEKLTPQQVLFWMNMMKVEKLNWCGYVPGTLPDDVSSISTSGHSVTFHLTSAANTNWFTYNQLSQITPMPMAWDISKTGQKAGSEACGTAPFASITTSETKDSKGNTVITPVSAAAKSCAAVFTYLDSQAKKVSAYAGSPLWTVVDGPWTLKGGSIDASGNVTFVPNKTYSGPIKPTLSKFVELPFTSDTAEFNALAAGTVDVGYLPAQDITSKATKNGSGPCDLKLGANNSRLAGSYTMSLGFPWSINYFPYNFNSSANNGTVGQIFNKAYFRQAFQLLVNQPAYISKIDQGYGVPTYGPVPVCPPNKFATSAEASNPYPYSLQKAVHLLTTNGWTVKPGGTTTCANAAKCGVPAGTPLSFNLQYASGTTALDQLMSAEKSSWAAAGIQVHVTTASFNTVIGVASPCTGGSGCAWQLENWGAGWIFAPDYYPTGEDLFQTGAGSNYGSYSNPTSDTLIKATTQGNANLAAYENYVARDLPVVWQPNPVTVGETSKQLGGVGPLNPLQTINPETWYRTK